jgi:polyribonucleotide nucleotidyltransferase
MQARTGTTITIEEVGNIGRVEICSDNKDGIEEVRAIIKGITTVPEVGEVYSGRVVQIVSFGAFVEFLPGKQGLLHISEIEWRRLETVDEVLKEGDVFDVKLIGIDDKTGKFKLSRKVLLPRPERTENNAPKAE